MADMLVKPYNIPRSHDTEENLLKSGIRIKKELASDRSRIIAFARTCAKDDCSDEVQAAFSNNPVICYITSVDAIMNDEKSSGVYKRMMEIDE